jgi:hypothetical protein
MLSRILLVAVWVSGMTGCVSPQAAPPAYPPDAFAHRVADSHVVLYWSCTRAEAGLLRLEGVAHNPWEAQPIRHLEFELIGVDAQDRLVSRATGSARDIQIFTNQITPFHADLKTTGAEARYDLFYQYKFSEADLQDARLAGSGVGRPRFFAQESRSIVRDACSETQHRAR